MTREEAIRILDPETTGEAISEIEYYGGFSGRTAVVQAVSDACVLAVSALREQEERENTKPLTLDELRQMDGEPVWIERCSSDSQDDKEWALVFDAGGFCRTSVGNIAFFALYGIGWLAYRSKPKEDA